MKLVPCIGKGHSLIRLDFDWAGQLPYAVISYPKTFTRALKKSHLDSLKDNLCFFKTVAMQNKSSEEV